jgi:hypothetical protein
MRLIISLAFAVVGYAMVQKGHADPHGLVMEAVGAVFMLIALSGAFRIARGVVRLVRSIVG